MPFTNTPTIDTYSTKRIPAVSSVDIPAGTFNTQASFGMRNVFPIKAGKEVWGETRYAINARYITSTNSAVRGMYVWEKSIGTVYYFVVVSNYTTSTIYTSTDGSSWSGVQTLTNDGQTPVRFTEFIDGTNTKKLILVDGIEGYVYTSNAAGTKITSANFPSPHVPFPIFLDGYLFLAKSGTGDIYNSNLNDPLTWTAGSFISAEMYPDDIQALLKINNYLLAVGTQSTEYFYDAANATASPLARVDGLVLDFGTPFPNSIAYTKDTAVLFANASDGSISVKEIKGTKTEDIECPFIDMLSSVIKTGTAATASTLRGWFYRQSDSLAYGFSFNGVNPASGFACPTFVYSFETKMWTEYTFNIVGTEQTFPVMFTSPTTSNTLFTYVSGIRLSSTNTLFAFFGTLGPSATGGQDSITDSGGTTTYIINQTIKTPILDFDNLDIKTMQRFSIICTSANSGVTPTSNVTVGWDDLGVFENGTYTSTTTTSAGFTFPIVLQLGAFRQRTFKINYQGTDGVRWKEFEMMINKGMR